MIISLNWLKKYTNIDISVEELSELIGSRLVEIEDIENIGEKYKDVRIVKVIEAKKLEGSDHLNIVKIDDGGVINKIERDNDSYIQVVCGAPNIATGQLVAWLPPESIVPETYKTADEFKLGVRNLRGVISNGMIASLKELGISDDHEGILVIDEKDGFKAGDSFTDAYELDDYLLNIENKSLTHRPDCFGVVGFAREIAAITGKKFKTVDWLMDASVNFGSENPEVELNVNIENADICSRYLAVVLSGADSKKKSPLLIQTYLSRVGVRPINSVVDVTNYLMLMTGQPLHAFDYDKLIALNDGKAAIGVRLAKEKEKLDLLDGRSLELSVNDIVITSGDVVVGLAGAMGGANTEIDDNTKKIIIESATFNLYNLRSTQMRHGIFSEAITRFTKGQPADQSSMVLSMAIKLTTEWSGAKVISKVIDSYPGKKETTLVNLSLKTVNETLGVELNKGQIENILNNAEFDVLFDGDDSFKVSVPYWRCDIHIQEDVIEEIGRLNGFDNIMATLPRRDFTAIKPVKFDDFRTKIRKILVQAGANEVLNYSFIHGDILGKVGQRLDNSYRLVNSISPELQYYRQTLTPSLLGNVSPNLRQGFDDFAIFEINKTHQKSNGLTEESVPVELNLLSFVFACKDKKSGAAFYRSKKVFEYLAKKLSINLVFKTVDPLNDNVLFAPFEFKRSAAVFDSEDNLIGVVGEYKKSVVRGFKLPDYISGFEIDLTALFNTLSNVKNNYQPISRYQSVERDICFQVASDVEYYKIVKPLIDAFESIDLEMDLTPVDIYQPKDSVLKNVTVRIKMVSHDHTLNNAEVSDVINGLIKSVTDNVGATVI